MKRAVLSPSVCVSAPTNALSPTERMTRLLAITDQNVLARIDAILTGKESSRSAEGNFRLLKYTEAAEMLNLSRPTIYKLVKQGRLQVVPIHGTNRITEQSVKSLFDATAYCTSAVK